jgi:hypothetical protein
MKRLLWFRHRSEAPIIEIVVSADSARWIADHLPDGDSAKDELLNAIRERSPVETGIADPAHSEREYSWSCAVCGNEWDSPIRVPCFKCAAKNR